MEGHPVSLAEQRAGRPAELLGHHDVHGLGPVVLELRGGAAIAQEAELHVLRREGVAIVGERLDGARGRVSTGDVVRQDGSSWQVHHGGRDGYSAGPLSCVIGEVTGRP